MLFSWKGKLFSLDILWGFFPFFYKFQLWVELIYHTKNLWRSCSVPLALYRGSLRTAVVLCRYFCCSVLLCESDAIYLPKEWAPLWPLCADTRDEITVHKNPKSRKDLSLCPVLACKALRKGILVWVEKDPPERLDLWRNYCLCEFSRNMFCCTGFVCHSARVEGEFSVSAFIVQDEFRFWGHRPIIWQICSMMGKNGLLTPNAGVETMKKTFKGSEMFLTR